MTQDQPITIGYRQGSKFGTERAEELLHRLGDPDNKLKIIHVAGSNGKGSFCAYMTSILVCAGKRVGAFTSPAVYSYEQCFCMDGAPPPKALLLKYLAAASQAAEGMDDHPSQFELEVCAALAMFAGEGCEYCVLECGLGGLYDATNAIMHKEVAVITSISLEHTDVLGDNLTDIYRHKAGIIKNCPVVVPSTICDEAVYYLAARGAVFSGQDMVVTGRYVDGQTFTYGGKNYSIRMHGDEQAFNACLAIDCAHILGIPDGAILRGLQSAYIGGRVEIIECPGALYILDGAHNPAAFSPLVQTLSYIDGTKTLVFTCLADKDVEANAAILGHLFDEILIVPAPDGRAMDINAIASAFALYNANVRICADIPAAMGMAGCHVVAVCGSFTLLKEAKKWIGQRQ